MKKIMLFSICLGFSLIMTAGGWVKKKGSGYSQLSFTYLKYDRLILTSYADSLGISNTHLGQLRYPVSDYTLQSYFEYGISNDITLILNVPYKFVQKHERALSEVELNSGLIDLASSDTVGSARLSALGHINLGARIALFRKNSLSLVFQGIFGLPSSKRENTSGLATGYGSYYFTPSIQLGYGKEKWYLSGEMGINFRGKNKGTNFIADLEFGRNFTFRKNKNLWVILALPILIPFSTDNNIVAVENYLYTGLYVEQEAWVSPGIKFAYGLNDHWTLNASIFGAVYADWGGSAPTITGGLAYEW